jgi:hypothetical protein
MFDATLVKYKTTASFGKIEIGSVINVYRLFKFTGKEALLYAPKSITGEVSCIFPAKYDLSNDYYIWTDNVMYVNGPDFTKEINAFLALYNFPKPPTDKEQRAIKFLEKAGYKVTK